MATVVVDTNVLLNLYRYNSATRNDLLDVLRQVGDRLWVPHQVMSEFWRNRLSVIVGRRAATDQVLAALAKQRRATADAIDSWARSAAVAPRQRDRMVALVDEMHRDLEGIVEEQAPDSLAIAGGAMQETVVRQLERLLEGRVGSALTQKEWREAIEEGKRRVAEQRPPGYLDAEKSESGLPEGACGDYLVWAQTLKEIKNRGGDLVLVTGDVKDDWWWRHRSEVIGPRQELVTEFAEVCGSRLYMLRPTDLLRRGRVFQVQVSEESVDDAERVDRRTSPQLWSLVGVDALLERLEAEGSDQVLVIREAAERGGRIERADIYKICGYDDDRMLRGFTRPTARITRDLQAEGLVPEGVEAALTPKYEGGVKAAAFTIPAEMVELLSRAADSESEVGDL